MKRLRVCIVVLKGKVKFVIPTDARTIADQHVAADGNRYLVIQSLELEPEAS
jgi:tellurite resistance-related uncharacterized protein